MVEGQVTRHSQEANDFVGLRSLTNWEAELVTGLVLGWLWVSWPVLDISSGSTFTIIDVAVLCFLHRVETPKEIVTTHWAVPFSRNQCLVAFTELECMSSRLAQCFLHRERRATYQRADKP